MSGVDWSGTARAEAELHAVEREQEDWSHRLVRARDAGERAQISARLAVLTAREAGWWRVLARRTPPGVPYAYRKAVLLVHLRYRDEARWRRESALKWREIAARQPRVGEPGPGAERCGVTR